MDIIKNLDVDSYKLSHYLQIPKDVTNVSAYIEARSGPDEIVFFGLQMWLKKTFENPVTSYDVDVLKEFALEHGLPFNRQFYDLVGKKIPLLIEALPEGSIVKPGIPLVQVMNTDAQYPWLPAFIETSLLRAIWYPTTVATNSRRIKQIIASHLKATGCSLDGLGFKLHDFGFRGVSSYESGCVGGLAHLVNFLGTDTMGALKHARKYYDEKMAGFSIPASEHSTITMWGRDEEKAAYANMIERFGHEGSLFACVSDSYDIYDACKNIWGGSLKEQVKNNGGTLVVRPDSGDPMIVVPKVLEILGDRFGTISNQKQFRMLPPYIRVIQGDGVNPSMINNLLGKMAVHGWAADNLAFGMGGALLQGVGRDDLSFAMKASAKSVNNGMSWIGFAKDPVTQSSKKSKKGRLAVVKDYTGELHAAEMGCLVENVLEPKFHDGRLLNTTTFGQVRERAAI